MLSYPDPPSKENGIVIVGLGGAGAHILQRFSGSSAENVRLCIMSPDERLAGHKSGNVRFLQLGAGFSHGLGTGGDPEVGRMALEESRESIRELLSDARLLVMVVGLGGGTGSGVAPALAEMAVQAGVFLVSVVVMPFGFEGHRRRAQADSALESIAAQSDIVFCFENDYMEELFDGKVGVQTVFESANTLLAQATASIPLMANSPGLINIGLDELITALRNNDSRCIYGSGSGYGPKRAEQAARAALESPLPAYHNSLRFAHTLIVHIAGGSNMSLSEVRSIMDTLREGLPETLEGEEPRLFFGASVKRHLGDEIRVSILAGIDAVQFGAVVRAEKEAAATPPPVVIEEEEPEDAPQTEEAESEGEEELFEEDAPEELPVEAPSEPATGRLPEPEPREEPARPVELHQRELFEEDETVADPIEPELPMHFVSPPDTGRRSNKTDWETPPLLRYNDLRDIFPE